MTDTAYHAKNWLLRTNKLEEKLAQATNKLAYIESRVNKSVSSYERNGTRDLISAQANREDLLLDYSIALDEYEQIYNMLTHENVITLRVIERLPTTLYRVILLARYINKQSITSIVKHEKIEYKKTQLYTLEAKALEELAEILATKQPEIIPTENKENVPVVILSEAPA